MKYLFPTLALTICVLGAALAVFSSKPGREAEHSPPTGVRPTVARAVGNSLEYSAGAKRASVQTEWPAFDRLHLASGLGHTPSSWKRLIAEESDAEKLQEILIRWSREDPRSAMQWTERLHDPALRRSMSCTVAREWALRDREAAQQWLGQCDSTDRDEIIVAMAYAVVIASPAEAVNLALQMSPGGQQPALLGQAVTEWAVHEPGAAAAWTGKLPPGELRDHVVGALATMFAEEDGAGAADLALELLPVGPRQKTAIGAIVQRWTHHEPWDAARWIERLPDGPVQTAAIENLVATWGNRAPLEVARWLEGLSRSPIFKQARGVFIRHMASKEPSTIQGWSPNSGLLEARDPSP